MVPTHLYVHPTRSLAQCSLVDTYQIWTTDSSLSGQTIFMPKSVPAGVKVPVITFGVGGCNEKGTNLQAFHHELASHGYIVLVNNGPTSNGQTNAKSLTAAADWITKVAGTGNYAAVDASRMAVSGWSCGGLQAYEVMADSRFSVVGIFSSGQFSQADSQKVAGQVKKPIFYFMGGSSDVAYANVSLSCGNNEHVTEHAFRATVIGSIYLNLSRLGSDKTIRATATNSLARTAAWSAQLLSSGLTGRSRATPQPQPGSRVTVLPVLAGRTSSRKA